MPLSNRIVGATSPVHEHLVDARWLMAYAAGLEDTNPRYFDTMQPLAIHPLFPVCLEWDAILAVRRGRGAEEMSDAEQLRAVHAEHDLHLLKPLQPGMRVKTQATAIAVEARKPGVNLIKRIDTVGADGGLLYRTYQSSLYRGVALHDEPLALETPPAWPTPQQGEVRRLPLPIPAGAAHVYTECARIWNPIHTDRAHALAAGLPDIILHGTTTLARAVSLIVGHYLDDQPARVTRVGCRFSGMVLMPSTLTLRIDAVTADCVNFTVLSEADAAVITRGFLCFARPVT